MGNNTHYYFGAYLVIEVAGILREDWQRICINRHKVPHSEFCPKCGEVAFSECFYKQGKANLYDIFQDKEHYDYLSDTTPETMREVGRTIIAMDNTGDVERWLSLDKFETEIETKPFPTFSQIEKMKQQFRDVHAERIAFIEAHKIVISATIEAGFLLQAEY